LQFLLSIEIIAIITSQKIKGKVCDMYTRCQKEHRFQVYYRWSIRKLKLEIRNYSRFGRKTLKEDEIIGRWEENKVDGWVDMGRIHLALELTSALVM
jgi:hypothetical protein